MGQNLSGYPKAVVELIDFSTLIANTLNGIWCVQGVTMRGKKAKPIFVGSPIDYDRKCGGEHPTSIDPVLFKRALEAGAQLYIVPVGHYTDITDPATLVGTKATATLTVNNNSDIDGTLISSDMLQVEDDWTGKLAVGGSVTVANSTANDGVYTVASFELNVNGTSTNIYMVETISDPTIDGDITLVQSVTIDAEEIGPGYDGTTITLVNSISGNNREVDMVVALPGSDVTLDTVALAKEMTAAEIAIENNILEGIQIKTITGTIPQGTITLAGGVEDVSLLTDTDYIGNAVSKLGWYAFDTISDTMRIANLTKPSPLVDVALDNYCRGREDMRFISRTPVGTNGAVAKDYRWGTGIYTHTAINSLYGALVTGDLNINMPKNTKDKRDVTALADVMGAISNTDKKKGEWFSAAGLQRGLLFNNNGVPYNLFTQPGLFNTVYEGGINAVIEREQKVVYWGNRSLLQDRTKLTSKDNVADLMVFLYRTLKPLVEKYLFDPNDPQTWAKVYRQVRPFIIDVLEAKRAIRKGEGVNWFWFGDQGATTVDDIKFNKRSDIDAGKYRIRFVFVPIPAIEYIGLELFATDSGTVKSIEIISNPDITI